MRQVQQSPITAQGKIIGVNEKMGNPGIAKQQGTTVEIYDSVPVVESANTQVLEFFIDSKTRSFPDTNLKDGKLQAQEALVVDRLYFLLETRNSEGNITSLLPIQLTGAANFLALGEFSLDIANDRVLKPIPMSSLIPELNLNPGNDQSVFDFDTQIVIPPLLEFKLTVKIPSIPAPGTIGDTRKVRAVIGGVGAIFRPKNAY